MMPGKKRLISILIAFVLVLSSFSSLLMLNVSATGELTMPGGAKWWTSSDTPTDYTITWNTQNGYSFQKKATFFGTYSVPAPVASSTWKLSLDYRSDNFSYFGITKSYSVMDKNAGTAANGSSEKLQFVYAYTGVTVQLFVDMGGGTWRHIANVLGKAKNNLTSLSFVKQGGSWYLSYDGAVLDGVSDGAAANANLEQYVGSTFFENDTPAYFQFGAKYDATDGVDHTAYRFVPPAGLAGANDGEIFLSDGTKWWTSVGTTNGALDTPLDYEIKGSKNKGYNFERNKTFFGTYSEPSPVATSEWQLSLDYRYSDNARFGVSRIYNAYNPEAKTTLDEKSPKLQFLLANSSNTVQIFIDAINPSGQLVLYHLANIPNITKQNVADISFVKQNGSWYLSYRGVVVDGSSGTTGTIGTSIDTVTPATESAKLERYMGADFFESNAPAYFQFGAGYDATGGEGSADYYFLPPTQKDTSWTVNMFGRPPDYNGTNPLDLRNHTHLTEARYPTVTGTASGGYTVNLNNIDIKTYGTNVYETMSYAQLNYAFTLQELLTKKISIDPLLCDSSNTRLSIMLTNDPNAPMLKKDIAKSANPSAKMVAIDLIADPSWVHAQLQTSGNNVGSDGYGHSAFNSAGGYRDYFDGANRTFSFVQESGSWYIQADNAPYAAGPTNPLNFVFRGSDGILNIFEGENIYVRIGLQSPNVNAVTPLDVKVKILNASNGADFLAAEAQKAANVQSQLDVYIQNIDSLPISNSSELEAAVTGIEAALDGYEGLGKEKIFLSKASDFMVPALAQKLEDLKVDLQYFHDTDIFPDIVNYLLNKGDLSQNDIDEMDTVEPGVLSILDLLGIKEKLLSYIPKSESATLYVEDFGAVGDGITDDAVAIQKAVNALNDGDTLIFEDGKSYYAKNSFGGGEYIINLSNVKNITLQGNDTTLLINAPKAYMQINDSENVTVTGLNFDYKIPPAIRLSDFSSYSSANRRITYNITSAERSLLESAGMTAGGTYNRPGHLDAANYFGVVDRADNRYPLPIQSYQLSSNGQQLIITFASGASTTNMGYIGGSGTKYPFIAPVPNVGHIVERGFSLNSNKNFDMSDCNVYAACKFAFVVSGSEGTMNFSNVNIESKGNINFAGWRDGFHCKDNRAKIVWENCVMKQTYDDMINISSQTMTVQTVTANNDITMSGANNNLKAGDRLTIINTSNGQLIGSSAVNEVLSQNATGARVTLTDPISGVGTGSNIIVLFDSLSAPDSEINNCDMDGTFRFRGSLTVTGGKIYNRRMWMGFDISATGSTNSALSYAEGPLPQNILFQNVAFTLDGASGNIFHIVSRFSNSASNPYSVKGIVFDGCTGLSGTNRMQRGNLDEVIVK